MARPHSPHPTELELQILKILWAQAPRTAREIRDTLAELGRVLAHTSVLTTLSTMLEKRQLKRLPPEQGKAFRFAPRIRQRDVSRRMLGDLLHRVFDGSAEAVMLKLSDVSHLNKDEVSNLRRLFDEKLREQDQDKSV